MAVIIYCSMLACQSNQGTDIYLSLNLKNKVTKPRLPKSCIFLPYLQAGGSVLFSLSNLKICDLQLPEIC